MPATRYVFSRISLNLVIAAMFLCPSLLFSDTGVTGAETLNRRVNARVSAMGEACTSMPDGLDVIGCNPAGISYVKDRQASLSGMKGFTEGEYFSALSFGSPVRTGSIAFGISYYTGGTINLIDSSWNETDVSAQRDYLLSAGYGRQIREHLDAGINIKYLRSELVEEFSANAVMMDAGAQYFLETIPLRTGIALQNIGTAVKYDRESDPLPLTLRLGISYDAAGRFSVPLLMTLDAVKIKEDPGIKEHIGLEYAPNDMLTVRGGYKIGYDLASFTLGAGFSFDPYILNYSYGSMGDLSPEHRISLNVMFSSKHGGFYEKGMAYYRENNHEEAGRAFYQYLAKDPGDRETQDKVRQVITDRRDNPAYCAAATELARQYAREHRYKESIEMYDYAIGMAKIEEDKRSGPEGEKEK
ncbi:MAG: PorV/PorQ family protein [Elusimicrobia bacterium]|nr:PorV/PorQ family protein [Elusimicrobiota bacterium]